MKQEALVKALLASPQTANNLTLLGLVACQIEIAVTHQNQNLVVLKMDCCQSRPHLPQ